MERRNGGLSRRDVIKGAAGMLAAAQAGGAPVRAAKPAGRPKVGCVSWCFHSFDAGASPEAAIEIIGKIGFEGLDLILLAREDIPGFWTDAKIGQIRKQLERNRLQVAQFVLFQPVVEGLTSTDPDERKRNLDHFEAGCRIGKKLDAPIINIVAPWAREVQRPGGGYLPRFYELPNAKPGEKFRVEVAPGFDWDRLWSLYAETTKACLERVKAHGMKLSIEHHTHTMIPEAASFLRLWDAIRDPALGYNLDTGWTMAQREFPPVAIHKVKDRLMNVHARDIDGLMRAFIHVGEGVMDFQGIAEAVKRIGFSGFLSIEQDPYPGDMEATCRRYLSMMKEYLA